MSTDTNTLEAVDPNVTPIDPDLKSERVQEEGVAPEPVDPLGPIVEPEPGLKSERVQ
jgi:hypothetical protein